MKLANLTTMLVILLLPVLATAGNDPSIKGQQRESVKQAMNGHINTNLIKGQYVVFDGQTGGLKRLALKELHSGIVKKGDFFVSCADFVDASGKLYDLDFLVAKKESGDYQVIQSLIHAVEGKKRAYHVEG